METTTETQTTTRTDETPRTDTAVAEAVESVRQRVRAGLLLFAFGLVTIMGIITAEAFYPGYNAGVQEISDLGATVPPNSVILQPSATIFNTTMLVAGLLVLGATYFLHRAYRDRPLTAVFALLSVGLLGVGVFDGSEVPMHGLFALLTFTTGGLAALVASRVVPRTFRYASLAVGGFVLLLLASVMGFGIAGITHPMAPLGLGGVERFVAYPVVLWLLAFGGYLLAGPAESEPVAVGE
ncbi:DUF998 domain-containing protein [Salinirubrum litoreum]|uniref:DUF998 domain-containing protein n=1 Tax=Salinirubrum litoreum TaxID=1126234 RepID=A0ABD5R965_9EURY|nr:DUF998 domain-containing protein [Salinirubrum litoreum]